jgi:5-formyltetrahydrofolate cyclo-ligase
LFRSFAIRNPHHHYHHYYFSTELSADRNLDNSMDESSATVAEDATQLLRKNKQTLRTIIRSRIKSAYPKNNDNNNTSAAESDQPSLLSAQSNQVFSRLFNLPQYKDAKSIGFFLSMPWGEIQTKHAIQRIVKDGKVLYVPRVGLDFELCDMDLIRCDTTTTTSTTVVTTSSNTGNVDNVAARDGGASAATDGEDMFYDCWPRNKWGIPEPPVTTTNVAKQGDIDLLIVPGLAFDTNGHRLGQGKRINHITSSCQTLRLQINSNLMLASVVVAGW